MKRSVRYPLVAFLTALVVFIILYLVLVVAAKHSTVATPYPQCEIECAPQVAMNGDGDAVYAWTAPASGSTASYRIYGVYHHDVIDTRWTRPKPLTGVLSTWTSPAVGIDDNGNGVIAWAEHGQARDVIKVIRVHGGNFDPVQTLARVPSAGSVAVAVNTSGLAVVSWTSAETSTRGRLFVAESQASGGTWLTQVVHHGSSLRPRLLLSADGQGLIVWMNVHDSRVAIDAAYQPSGGAWSEKSVAIAAKLVADATPTPLLDPMNRVAVAWPAPTKLGGVHPVARVFDHGTWQPASGELGSVGSATPLAGAVWTGYHGFAVFPQGIGGRAETLSTENGGHLLHTATGTVVYLYERTKPGSKLPVNEYFTRRLLANGTWTAPAKAPLSGANVTSASISDHGVLIVAYAQGAHVYSILQGDLHAWIIRLRVDRHSGIFSFPSPYHTATHD